MDLLVEALPSTVVSQLEIAPRSARFRNMPARYISGPAGEWARAQLGTTDLYRHQSLSLELAQNGKNIVLNTGTASGKTAPLHILALDAMPQSDATELWMFPTKALCGDQLARMRRVLQQVGFSPSKVQEITGDIPPQQRESLLASCQIAICTPDIMQAWLMRSYASPTVSHFLSRLCRIFIDEAHLYEGMLGSNTAFLLRRLQKARRRIRRALNKSECALQFIAASATIADAEQHLFRLTGQPFVAIGEEENGAPFAGLTISHVEFPARGAAAERAFAEYLHRLVDLVGNDAFIGFADGRQSVERITRYISHPLVHPYRAGYDLELRRDTEGLLRSDGLTGVVSTSALEVGIDVPQFVLGLNLGIPYSIKSAKQRIGRIGRNKPAAFAFCAEKSAFSQLGMTLEEYIIGPAEPSHIYIENQLIQFGNARCFVEEFAPEEHEVPRDWAPGFAEMVVAAMPGGVRPRAVSQIAIDGGSPHLAYPVRSISERTFGLKVVGRSGILGTIEADKALRETYPGGTYFHHKKAFRVLDWRASSYENVILLEPAPGAEVTRPMLRTQINISEDPAERLDNHLLTGAGGSLSEMCLRVYESVEGYTVGSKSFPYRDLAVDDSRLSRKSREYSSTGVVWRIAEPWFAGASESVVDTRRAVAEAISKILCREFSISPGDIRTAHTGIALHGASRPHKIDDAIVIFDTALGGLRLSAPAFEHAFALIERLRRAAAIAGEEALLDEDTVQRLGEWFQSLEPTTKVTRSHTGELDAGEIIVFAPNSEVGIRSRGNLIERTLIEPQFVSFRGEELLMYRYETAPGISAWVAHDEVQAIGDNWRKAI